MKNLRWEWKNFGFTTVLMRQTPHLFRFLTHTKPCGCITYLWDRPAAWCLTHTQKELGLPEPTNSPDHSSDTEWG